MRKLFKNPLAYGFLVGAGIAVESTFVSQPEAQAEVTIMADCCQEIAAECDDRFGWKYADSRPGGLFVALWMAKLIHFLQVAGDLSSAIFKVLFNQLVLPHVENHFSIIAHWAISVYCQD